MTVTNETSKIRYTGNGATVDFTFPFKTFANTDIDVYTVVIATGVATLKTLTTHYTVAINENSDGGTVTMVTAPTSAQELLIRRALPRTQSVDLPAVSNFPETSVENALDKAMMILAEVDETLARCLKFDDTLDDSGLDTEIPTLEAGKVLAVNDDANGFELVENSVDAAAAAAVSAAAAAASASAASSSESSASTSASTATTQAAAAAASAAAAAASAAAAGGTVSVTQSSHGFSVGNLIYFNGTIFVKAVATSVAAAEVVGIVSTVTDSNNFIYTLPGRVITGLSGLTAGVIYYLSTSSAGATQTSKPTVAGQVIKTIMVALSTTSAIFLDQYSDLIASAVSTKFIQGAIADLSATLGTVDYTSAGIGTPKGAIITISINTADYATWAMYDQDGAGKCMESNAGVVSSTTSLELEISTAGGTQSGAVSMITDGIRIAYTKVSSPTGTATLNILLIY